MFRAKRYAGDLLSDLSVATAICFSAYVDVSGIRNEQVFVL